MSNCKHNFMKSNLMIQSKSQPKSWLFDEVQHLVALVEAPEVDTQVY